MKQMQGLDAAFLALEQEQAPIHIGNVQIYDPSTAPDGLVRHKDILNFLQQRLHLAPIMRQRMVKIPFGIDYPYWINDPKFDLEYHIRHVALPEPKDWRQLCILTARNFSRPLNLNKPMWELLIVEGLDNVEGIPKGSFAILSKVHHAAIDGASGVDIMHALHKLDPSVDKEPVEDTWKADSIPSQIGMFARGSIGGFMNPIRQIGVAVKAVPDLLKVVGRFLGGEFNLAGTLSTPRTRFNGLVSAHRVFDAVNLSLAEVKELRKLVDGATVNDVMLSIIGGALRRYLIDKDELPNEPMTAMAPISVRQESEKNAMGNEVSAMRVTLGTLVEDDLERLQLVHDEVNKSKAMTNALGARQMTEMSKHSPALFIGLGARAYSQFGLANRIKPFFNTVVTNVPGPAVPLYSAGAKLVAMYGVLPVLDGVTLGHVVHSYVDEITIGITACREALEDPHVYAQCIQDSYDAHAAHLAGKKKKKKAKNRTRKVSKA